MKANAPEKIYLNPLIMEDGESIVRRCTFDRQRDSQIEYTRTDAFIEKACEWLKENAKNYIVNTTPSYQDAGFSAVIGGKCWEDFEKYMKGE